MKKYLLVPIFLVFFGFLYSGQVLAETKVSGNITDDTIWTKDNTPYIVNKTIQIFEGTSLKIEPGVVVKFNKDTGINVGGELVVLGTENQKIYFTSNESSPSSGDWNNIKFIDTAVGVTVDEAYNYIKGSIIKYAVLEYGGNNDRDMISVVEIPLLIENSTIMHGRHGIFTEGNGTIIKNNTISNNSHDGIRNYRNNAVIINNTVEQNEWYGIFNEGDNNLIKNNTVRNNGLGGIYEYGSNDNNILINNIVEENDVFGVGVSGLNTKFEGNTIANNNGHGIQFFSGEKIRLESNLITENTGSGVYMSRGKDVVIIHNTITKNYNNGIHVEYGGVYGAFGTIEEVNYNNIYNNFQYDFYNAYTNTIEAPNNYWGTSDTSDIDKNIFDYNDDIEYGGVEYEPYVFEPLNFSIDNVTGNITSNTIWTSDYNPYIIETDLQVFEDTILIIEEGVEVKIDPNRKIKIAGTLDVNGVIENPVVFTSNNNDRWWGIEFINSKGSSIQNTFFENAQRVFDLKDNSEVEFVGNIFKNNGWVITDTNGYQSMQFNNNTAVNNEAVFYGIRTNGLSRFTNNVFQNNESVFHHGYYSGDITIENNNFINNDLVVRAGEKGYYDNFSMQNSWWGTTDTEEIDTMIEDKYDNVELHTLTYLPVKNSFIEGIGSSINIDVLPPVPPIITAVQSPITAALQVISGTKEANSSIWLDGNQIIALNSSTSWKYTVSLETGNNSFILTAKDSSGNESGEVNITITREESTEEETKESTEENNTEEKNTNETSTEGSDEEESKNETPEDDTEATQEEKTLEENEEIQEDDEDTNIDETEENNTSTQDQGTDDETESDQDNSEEGANGSDESQGSQQTTQENSGELSKEVEDEEENSNVEQTEIETIVDTKLVKRVKGTILLQVEAHGEAYYIDPKTEKGYYLGRPLDAFNIMRTLGLGATHEFITSHEVYPDSVVGKILLDVETNGEAYYIYPEDKKAYYLGRPSDAFDIMRKLGLGITNENLNKILKAD